MPTGDARGSVYVLGQLHESATLASFSIVPDTARLLALDWAILAPRLTAAALAADLSCGYAELATLRVLPDGRLRQASPARRASGGFVPLLRVSGSLRRTLRKPETATAGSRLFEADQGSRAPVPGGPHSNGRS